MRRKIFTLFLALAAMTNVFASVQIGSLYYTLNDAEETAYVDEDPASIPPYKSLTSVIIPTTVTYNGKTYKVTAIGNNAFNGATNITSLVVSDNVTMIGHYAFNGCTKLASVILGQGIDTIGIDAFKNCSKLTNVTLMCDKIFKKTYKSDANIGTIFGEQVTDYTIGDGVKTIGSYAFGGCTNIKNITISNSVTKVYHYAFNGCSGLTQVSLPNSVTYVGYFVFANCSNLTAPVYNEHVYAYMPKSICPESVTIPEGITLIASGAFNGRNVLKSVTLPESLEEIGWAAFYGCTNLTTINFPNNIRRMESDAFFETGISTPLYNDYIYAYMPPSLLVSSVSIPEGIQEIARTAFYKCSELQSVEIPNSVTIIGGGAFKCSGVKYVSIGKNVSSIGTEVFYGCNHLEEIYNYATTPQNIVAPVFGGSDSYPAVDKTKCKLYVPEASVEAYKAKDVWKEFTNIIGFIPDIVKIGDLYYSLNDENHTAWVTYETLAYEDGELKYENYKGLKNVTVPSEVTYANEQYTVISIGMAAFAGSNIESIDIPASVEAIGPSAISDCFALKTVTLHEGLKTIYSQAFAGCIQLESIDIPAGVEEIRDGAFAVCPALKSVTIPESVTRIGEWVFYCCSSLAQITNYATTPQYIVASVFGGNDEYPAVDKTKCKLYVPEASVEAYKAANVWKDFGDNIIGIKDPQGIESIQPSAISHQKVIRDGLLLIEKNGKTYNAQGVEIK